MSPLSYPPFALDTRADCQALTAYQSQLLWIGRCDRHSDKIKVFVLDDESTHSWKQVMHNIPQQAHTLESPVINFISATSEGKYLIIVVSKGYRGMAVLVFDGQEWRIRDTMIPSRSPESAYGETDVIIHNGIIYLCTQVGFYRVHFETNLATNHLLWKTLTCVPEKCHSNLTIINGHIMVFIATPASEKSQDVFGRYVYIMAYQPIDNYWLVLKKFECHLCWAIPSIVGLPSGRLLILGVTPDSVQFPLFNILEVIVKGNHIYV